MKLFVFVNFTLKISNLVNLVTCLNNLLLFWRAITPIIMVRIAYNNIWVAQKTPEIFEFKVDYP